LFLNRSARSAQSAQSEQPDQSGRTGRNSRNPTGLTDRSNDSFTGADISRHGKFQQADRGTIFLDEISNISEKFQYKLLRVLQEFEITPVGSAQQISVDVRVIAATNAHLSEHVKNGDFRKDLYYRLNVIPICLPPLRKRREDIPLVVRHFFDLSNRSLRSGQLKNMTDSAMRVLTEYDWPGNVRELENVIERAVVLCEAESISEKDFEGELTKLLDGNLPAGGRKDPLCEAEKQHIREVLARHNFNIAQSARVLQIDRKTLRLKARKYGLIPGVAPGGQSV